MSRAAAGMKQAAAPDLSVGRATAREETRADHEAAAATERLGLGYARGAPGGDPLGGAAAPGPALAAAAGRGRPLPAATRATMERGFGRDFGHVRIHDGPAAARGARALAADAYALGPDVIFAEGAFRPDTRPGAALLSHELAHTLADEPAPTIRRGVGFFENIARFFGGGTFSDAELKDYLYRLSGKNPTGETGKDTGAIEGDFDGDNKARAVVEKNMHKDQPIRVRHLLIEEMLDGHVSEADEEKIVQILEDAVVPGDAMEIIELVGSDLLQKKLSGKEYDALMAIIGRVRSTDPLPAVPLDWKVNYTVSGAPNAMPGKQGVLLRDLSFQTTQGKRTPLATGASVTNDGQVVAPDAPHPRNEAGEVSVDAAPGAIQGNAVVPDATGAQQAKTSYPVVSHHYDTAEVLLDLFYGERQVRVDKTGKEITEGTEKGTDKGHTEGSSALDRTGTNKTTGEDKTTGVTVGKSEGEEVGGSVSVKKGGAVRVGREEKEVDLKEEGSSESDVDLTTDVDTEDDVDLTAKTTGTNTTTGDITIDLDDVTFDADVKSELEGTGEVRKGGESITRKLKDLTEPIRRKIIEKVLQRYLGPAAGPGTEAVEFILDKLIAEPPDWTVTLEGDGTSSVSGSVSGEVKGKWKEVEEVNLKTKTTGKVKRTGKEKTKGKVKTESEGTVKGTEEVDKAEVEASESVEATASGKLSQGRKVDVTKEKTEIDRTETVDEHEEGTSKSDTTTTIDRKIDSEADFTGTDRLVYEAFFDRADLRVRLTGEKGRYHLESEPGQRGGGGKEPNPQKETGK